MTTTAAMATTTDGFLALLAELTGISTPPNERVIIEVDRLFAELGPSTASADVVRRSFYGRMNQKLELNKSAIRDIYGKAAKLSVTFNYPQKRRIEWAVNTSDEAAFLAALRDFNVPAAVIEVLADEFRPITVQQTRRLIADEIVNPTKLRRALGRSVEEDVASSSAGPLVWSTWAANELHGYFLRDSAKDMAAMPYMDMLAAMNPALFERHRSLVVNFADSDKSTPRELVDWLAGEWEQLDNHGYVAAVLDVGGDRWGQGWEAAGAMSFEGERFLEREIPKAYFRWQKVREETEAHVPAASSPESAFELGNEGFTYLDTFVLSGSHGAVARLLVLLQKNDRDETLLPCPACRSDRVEGNSYPHLGVKSWECRNVLCPDRTIYNRGKRYEFRSLIKQAAIADPGNEVPVASARRWQRDVLSGVGDEELVTMLLQHYSKRGDVVVVAGRPDLELDPRDRKVVFSSDLPTKPVHFEESAYLKRFALVPGESTHSRGVDLPERWEVREGDSKQVLRDYSEGSFARAITSPPYYNAKEYSQWPNVYCYLHDMGEIAREVIRVLRPGGLYVYNIFDYFDNDRTITFSEMGKRRVPLAGMTIQVFKSLGFELLGNTPWDKGQIEGKRGFNGGNFSPFYQSPFNCWEHVLLFKKPGPSIALPDSWRSTAEIQPFIKMVRGENTLGHTAPYPLELVDLFLEGLEPGDCVLDPFGGSGTSAMAAVDRGLRALLVERHPDYVQLARRRVRAHEAGPHTLTEK